MHTSIEILWMVACYVNLKVSWKQKKEGECSVKKIEKQVNYVVVLSLLSCFYFIITLEYCTSIGWWTGNKTNSEESDWSAVSVMMLLSADNVITLCSPEPVLSQRGQLTWNYWLYVCAVNSLVYMHRHKSKSLHCELVNQENYRGHVHYSNNIH